MLPHFRGRARSRLAPSKIRFASVAAAQLLLEEMRQNPDEFSYVNGNNSAQRGALLFSTPIPCASREIDATSAGNSAREHA
jgi:hypothetical protein